MNAGGQSIGRASDTTSRTKPLPGSEREFLEQQAEIAREGLRRCLGDLQAEAREVADVSRLVRWKPLWALGIGFGGGLAAGGLLGKRSRHGAGAPGADGSSWPAIPAWEPKKEPSKLGALLAPMLVPALLGAGKTFLQRMRGGGEDGVLPPDLRLALGPLAMRVLKNLG